MGAKAAILCLHRGVYWSVLYPGMFNFTANEIMKKLVILLLLLMAPVMSQGLETSPVGVALIQQYEGLSLKAYKCPANVTTIGYGHTKFAKPGMRITKEQATAYLKYDLHRFENYVTRTIPRRLMWYENDALISFSFNLGYRLKDQLRTAIITQNTPIVVYKLKLYVKARVRGVLAELRGLVRRRNDEAKLYQGKFYELSFFENLRIETQREAVWHE